MAEKYALMSVYERCGGGRWLNKRGWGADAPLRDWFGVGINVEGYVVELNLRGNNLRGLFPDSLHALRRLEVLAVDDNFLTGDLPDYALCKITSLQVLSCAHNSLDGAIPFYRHLRSPGRHPRPTGAMAVAK